ncbi:hypothetical protein DNL40_10315 [Xylanimonas oleitrophica]|uniref:DNA-binding protein n=1 Tax=Xylanimonas oleitrophica TaxID=2607479 RepID=A0A2W5XSE9_9MICO|nr:SatD family protein [Xylanimonas oleitrophica]PZR52758.1 hypothetical protein DNL40_10315 [Xylanimonas oleitrophica]
MIVLTVDQRDSTGRGDHVPHLLPRLHRRTSDHPGLATPFDRTVGDEVQGVLHATPDGAALAVGLVLELLRDGGWSVGVGAGAVVEPLPPVSRDASGPAFVHAREAVERAKGRGGVPVAVEADDAARADEVEALLRLLGAVVVRRSDAGWEAVDTLAAAGTRKAVASTLGVSEQAVSQRLRTALWAEEEAVRPVVARLLHELAQPGPARGPAAGDEGAEDA